MDRTLKKLKYMVVHEVQYSISSEAEATIDLLVGKSLYLWVCIIVEQLIMIYCISVTIWGEEEDEIGSEIGRERRREQNESKGRILIIT